MRWADDETVLRILAGDAEALGDLYDRHVRQVYSLAVRIVRNHAEAEDVVQEVFVQAWRQAGRFDPARGPVAAWLLTITRSRAIDRLRRLRRMQEASTDVDVLEDRSSGSPEVAVFADEDSRQVRRALTQLAPEQRAAIELAYFEGLTHSEIAIRLQQPLGTVKTRIRLGLMTLRNKVFGRVRSA